MSSRTSSRSPRAMSRSVATSEVLPLPVAPVTRTFSPDRMMSVTISMRSVPSGPTVDGEAKSWRRNFRRRKMRKAAQVPLVAMGAMTAHTRFPSGSRASTIGDKRSRRRPRGVRIRSRIRSTTPGARSSTRWRVPKRSTQTSVSWLTRMSVTPSSNRWRCRLAGSRGDRVIATVAVSLVPLSTVTGSPRVPWATGSGRDRSPRGGRYRDRVELRPRPEDRVLLRRPCA